MILGGGRVEKVCDGLGLLHELIVLAVGEGDGGEDGPLRVQELEHRLGADLELDAGTLPLARVVYHHREAQVEVIS